MNTAGFVFCLVQTVTMIFGFTLVILKFRKYVMEISKTHDWNRRKASQEACYEFMNSRVQTAWASIYKAVIEERQAYEEVSESQQSEMREVIYYFENLGISLKNNILDEDIIWDYFGSVWPISYESAKGFVASSREQRSDDMIFEHFEDYAVKFVKRNQEIEQAKQNAGKVPGKPAIKG